jgi:hypothetical protein
VGWSDRLQQWLLRAGIIISAVLLVRFAIDFSEGAPWWLAAPFWILVTAALAVGFSNVYRIRVPKAVQAQRSPKNALLLAAIPLGFISSSLDCTGLSAQGCSSFCTLVKLVWIPVIAGACAIYCFSGKQGWLTAIAVLSVVPLVPHCVCYNVGNAWWIDRIGVSPLCYGWGFVVSMIAVGALRKGEHLWVSIAVCSAIVTGASAFFVTHHYFQFPW